MPVAGLLLAHGAGGGADHRTLVALDDHVKGRMGIPVRRMEFGYRAAGRRAPDRPPKLIAEVRDEAEAFAARIGAPVGGLVMGGRSMGGRMCSMAVAEGLDASGLVLLSYPLHPPGRPERLRVEHFGAVDVPTLVVNGDRDPFGTPEELERELAAVGGPVTLKLLKGQRHDPGPAADAEIVAAVAEFLEALSKAQSR